MGFSISQTFLDRDRSHNENEVSGPSSMFALVSWVDLPEGTRDVALMVEDLDGEGTEVWTCWSSFKASDSRRSLPAAHTSEVEPEDEAELDASGEPLPQPSAYGRAYFKLYALDEELLLAPNANRLEFLSAAHGHIIGRAVKSGELRDRAH